MAERPAAFKPKLAYHGVLFEGVSRGPRIMRVNGRLRPAFKWCEMFGHQVVGRLCTTCGGLRDGD